MRKTSRNVFLQHLREWVFHIYPRFHPIMGEYPPYFLEFLWIMLQYSIQTLCNIWGGTLFDKNIFLNVIGLLDLTLKHIDKFRLRQKSIPSGNYMFKVSKKYTITACQIYSKLTLKAPERRLVFLLLTLNIFCTLFHCRYCWIRANKCRLGLRNCSFRR